MSVCMYICKCVCMYACMYVYRCVYIYVYVCIYMCAYVCVCLCISFYEACKCLQGQKKAPFSIATTPRCRGGRYSFPWIAPHYP